MFIQRALVWVARGLGTALGLSLLPLTPEGFGPGFYWKVFLLAIIPGLLVLTMVVLSWFSTGICGLLFVLTGGGYVILGFRQSFVDSITVVLGLIPIGVGIPFVAGNLIANSQVSEP